MRKHDEGKKHTCPHCDFKNSCKRRMNVHIDSKHSDLYEKKIACSHCSRTFVFEDGLKKHMENQRTMAKNKLKKVGLGLVKRDRKNNYEGYEDQ